jgi:hypothetical protein
MLRKKRGSTISTWQMESIEQSSVEFDTTIVSEGSCSPITGIHKPYVKPTLLQTELHAIIS